MGTLSQIVTEIGPVKPWVEPVIKEVVEHVTAPVYFVYGYSPRGSGEHPKGRALDFGIKDFGKGEKNPGPERRWLGDIIANYLVQDYKRLNIWYVIWNGRIWSDNPDNQTAYHKWGKYSGDNPHTDHVHVSFYDNRKYTPPKGTDEMPDEKDVWQYSVKPGEASKAIALNYKLAPSYQMDTLQLGTFVRILRLEQLEQARYTALKRENETIKATLANVENQLESILTLLGSNTRQGAQHGGIEKVPE